MSRARAAAPPPPDPDPRRRCRGRPGRACGDAPARHRAEDAGRDRARRRRTSARVRTPTGGRSACSGRATGGRDDHDLALRPRRGRASAWARPGDRALDRQRRGCRPLHAAPAQRRGAARALAAWLVHDPQGWDEATGTPGSVRYAEGEVLDAFFDAASGEPRPVLMFVGRFLGFKRVPLLMRAYARARRRMSEPARSSSGAAFRASGRASIRTPSPRARASRACSSPGGAATTSSRSA